MTLDSLNLESDLIVSPLVKSLYTNVYAQAHSQEHQVIVAGTNHGNILVYDIKNILSQEEGTKGDHTSVGPVKLVDVSSQPVYSFANTGDLLVSGTVGSLSAWRWKDLASSSKKPVKQAWSIDLEKDQSSFGKAEVNSISQYGGKLWAACGDCKTRVYDLATGKLVDTLGGHTEYVHQVVATDDTVVTCGEDGCVLVWDPRRPTQPTNTLQPHTNPTLARPHLGKYVGCVDVACGEWVACGGGPRAAVWHLRAGAAVQALPPNDAAVTVARFVSQRDASAIVTAGDGHCVRVCCLSGQVTSELPTSSAAVYNVMLSTERKKLMTLAGQGNKIDVCLNMNYRDHSLTTDCRHLVE